MAYDKPKALTYRELADRLGISRRCPHEGPGRLNPGVGPSSPATIQATLCAWSCPPPTLPSPNANGRTIDRENEQGARLNERNRAALSSRPASGHKRGSPS